MFGNENLYHKQYSARLFSIFCGFPIHYVTLHVHYMLQSYSVFGKDICIKPEVVIIYKMKNMKRILEVRHPVWRLTHRLTDYYYDYYYYYSVRQYTSYRYPRQESWSRGITTGFYTEAWKMFGHIWSTIWSGRMYLIIWQSSLESER
jgi:hypothetical protein